MKFFLLNQISTRIFLSTACIIIYSCCFAQDKIETDRPDQTETAELVPAHYFQAEFGTRYESLGNNNYDVLHPVALLKYSLSKSFELRFEDAFKTEYRQFIPNGKSTTGFEPVAFGFKAALFNENKFIPKTSLITQIAIPSLASKSFQANHIAPSFLFAMKNTISKSFDIGYNLGAEWDGFSTAPTFIYSASFGFELGEKWAAYAEPFGFIKKDETPETVIDGGFQYYLSNDVKIDASAGFGISKVAPDYYIDLGLSFRFH